MSKIKEVIDKLGKIGTIGSPSFTTELSIDILGAAVEKKLVGELALFDFKQDDKEHIALGQITDIKLRNSWLEDSTMRSLARQRGRVNPISGQQDIHLGEMSVSAVFSEENDNYEPSILGTVPPTGTYIRLANDELINTLLERHKNEIFYLGNVYGSKPLLPTWFKHFDYSSESFPGGAGEAYHLGIFGKSGSGKSVLAKTAVLAYSRHKNMGVFILDLQGEFSKNLRQPVKQTQMRNVLNQNTLKSVEREFKIYDLNNIILDTWDLFFTLLLQFNFFFELGFKNSTYQDLAAEHLRDFCRSEDSIALTDLNSQALKLCIEYLKTDSNKIYDSKNGIARVSKEVSETTVAIEKNENHRIINIWNNVSQFFQKGQDKKSSWQIVSEVVDSKDNRPLTSIDLSIKPDHIRQYTWDEKIKPLIIDRFLTVINVVAEKSYKEDMSLNTLVVIDEAHRLAPRGKMDNEKKEKIRNRLIDSVRTTRKYGLGWLFISQTLSSLDKDIIDQLRINFFGFGLSMGSEFQALSDLAGGEKKSLKLYQSFRDPHSSFSEDSRQYSFMTIGPVSPLSFSGTPLFLTNFNSADDFLKSNNLQI
jgi:ABC-type dipeptide/oligopeptide/nickel transport system ATPase subunit